MRATQKPTVNSPLPAVRIWGDYNEDLPVDVVEVVVSDNKAMYTADTSAVIDIITGALRKAGYKME